MAYFRKPTYYFRPPDNEGEEWYDRQCQEWTDEFGHLDSEPGRINIEITDPLVASGVRFYGIPMSYLFDKPLPTKPSWSGRLLGYDVEGGDDIYRHTYVTDSVFPPFHIDKSRIVPTKPSWSDVPEGCDWMAQGCNGWWACFREKPKKKDTYWYHNSRGWLDRGAPNPNWKDTLEQRPEKNLYRIASLLDAETSGFCQQLDGCLFGGALGGGKTNLFYESMFQCVRDFDKMIHDAMKIPHGIMDTSGKGEPVSFTHVYGESLINKAYRERMWNLCLGNLPTGGTMNSNSCPVTRPLNPLEQIHAKGERLTEEINALNVRKDALDKIEDSVNWKSATEEIKIKAVEAADNV